MAGTDKKTITRSRILNYVINNQITSKAEVSKNLNLSMPTVLSNINDLIAKGIIIETGEYESTGGRKAKSIGINPSYRYSVGIVITANHVGIVLVNLKYEIVKFRRVRMKFSPDASYCQDLSVLTSEFLKDTEYQDRDSWNWYFNSGNHQSESPSAYKITCIAAGKLQPEFFGTGI